MKEIKEVECKSVRLSGNLVFEDGGVHVWREASVPVFRINVLYVSSYRTPYCIHFSPS